MVEASIESWLTTGKFNVVEKLANFIGIKHLITVLWLISQSSCISATSSELGEELLKRR